MNTNGAIPSPKRSRMQFGRAPWYDELGRQKSPFMIGVTGGSASGKTTVCKKIIERLGIPWVAILSMDNMYKGLTDEQSRAAHAYNFDHPAAFDWELFLETVQALKTGRNVRIPKYSFETHQRLDECEWLYGADVVIVEGILSLHDKRIRDEMDMMIFVETDSDICLTRRIRRDVAERGRTVESVLNQYLTFVKPAFDNFILPTKRYADIIIPRGGDNEIAINLMASHIRRKLESRGFVNTNLVRSLVPSDFELDDSSLPKNVLVLPQNNTIKYIHTQLRDKNTEQEEFQFQVDRLTRLLMDMLHDVLPVQVQSVKTPTNGDFYGEDLKNKICGVSIVRSGLGLENALRTMYPDTSFGKIIVQQTKDKKEGPRLYYCKFPPNMQKMKVVLLDAMCSTGNVVSMAIRVLLDHNVPEENITFMCLMVCPEGAMQLARSYPKIKIITSWVEERVDHRGFAVPGMGSFGDRYFGTQSVSYDDLAYDGVPRSTNPSKANSMIGSRSGSEHGFSDIKKNLESLVLSDSSLGQTDIAK